jgi:hypothetical protein
MIPVTEYPKSDVVRLIGARIKSKCELETPLIGAPMKS